MYTKVFHTNLPFSLAYGTTASGERELVVERIDRKATIITRMRRTGKSVYQSLYCNKRIASGVPKENICILDFSDDHLYGLRSHDPGLISDA